MKTIYYFKILFILFALVFIASNASSETREPFWQSQPKEMRKIIQERKVSVSAKVKEVANDKQQHMNLQGVGLVSAPASFSGPWLLNYANLKRISGYVQEARWDQKTKVLFLHTEAMGYHARMHVKMLSEQKNGETVVRWTVLKGFLKNLSGTLSMKKQGFDKTLFSIIGIGAFEKSNIPKVFIEFGFEVFIQKFAEKLRSLIEQDFKTGTTKKGK